MPSLHFFPGIPVKMTMVRIIGNAGLKRMRLYRAVFGRKAGKLCTEAAGVLLCALFYAQPDDGMATEKSWKFLRFAQKAVSMSF